MTSARERLAMLHSHIKDNSHIKLLAEFPILVESERQKYLNNNFQSVPGNRNSSYFASSVMRQTKKPVMSISSLESNNPAIECSSQQSHFEFSASRSISSTSRSFTNLEFDELCNNVDGKLRLLLGNNVPCDSYMLSGEEHLGWDFLGSNIVSSSTADVLCISTGFYSKKFAEHLQTYAESEGRGVTVLEAKIGHNVPLELIKKELLKKTYGIVALTHTDNSTGVVTDINEVSKAVKQICPNCLVVVDAVYSVGVEEIQVDNWEIDFTLCTYQSSIFTTKVLSYILLSSRVLLKASEVIINGFDSSNNNKKQLAYSEENFQIVNSLKDSLQQLFRIDEDQDTSFDITSTLRSRLISRFSDHKSDAEKLRKALVNEENGITTVSEDWSNCSNGMTVVYFPKTNKTAELLKALSEDCDICLVSGSHPRIASEYISIEHVGFRFSGNDIDVDKVIEIIQKGLVSNR